MSLQQQLSLAQTKTKIQGLLKRITSAKFSNLSKTKALDMGKAFVSSMANTAADIGDRVLNDLENAANKAVARVMGPKKKAQKSKAKKRLAPVN